MNIKILAISIKKSLLILRIDPPTPSNFEWSLDEINIVPECTNFKRKCWECRLWDLVIHGSSDMNAVGRKKSRFLNMCYFTVIIFLSFRKLWCDEVVVSRLGVGTFWKTFHTVGSQESKFFPSPYLDLASICNVVKEIPSFLFRF